MPPLIHLKNISKTLSDQKVLDDISFYVNENEFLTLLGPSGCGKTTTLRLIGGFDTPDTGEIIFQDQCINNLPAYKRNVNTVFQKYALFSHLNIFENVAFGLKIKKFDKSVIHQRVTESLSLVGLRGFEKRHTESLSGGQQQRVAIARALVNRPKVLLLDEPLGALDLKLRKEMQLELKNIQQKVGITFIYVTHDQEEALTMSDTIIVMNEGAIQQIGTPVDIYNEPRNRFVANFIGESNILDGIMLSDCRVIFCTHEFICVDKGFEDNEPVDIVIRPEDIVILAPNEGHLEGLVTNLIFKGVHYEMTIECAGFTFKAQSTVAHHVGNQVSISIAPDAIHVMKRS